MSAALIPSCTPAEVHREHGLKPALISRNGLARRYTNRRTQRVYVRTPIFRPGYCRGLVRGFPCSELIPDANLQYCDRHILGDIRKSRRRQKPKTRDNSTLARYARQFEEDSFKIVHSGCLSTNFPSQAFLLYLVKDLAYPPECALACLTHGHIPMWRMKPDRRSGKTVVEDDLILESSALTQPHHPFVAASPTRRTRTGGGMTREQVAEAMGQMRLDGNTQGAMFEIVFRRWSVKKVAASRNLSAENLHVYASRVRKRVRDANKQCVFSRSVKDLAKG